METAQDLRLLRQPDLRRLRSPATARAALITS
eukprot:SAG31_NODE_32369_length_357_cov_0.476744_1_plen_31_part_10